MVSYKPVVVQASYEYTIMVPEDWDAKKVEFHRNESSWCASNGVTELTELWQRQVDNKKIKFQENDEITCPWYVIKQAKNDLREKIWELLCDKD